MLFLETDQDGRKCRIKEFPKWCLKNKQDLRDLKDLLILGVFVFFFFSFWIIVCSLVLEAYLITKV